jgi:Zn-dependent peptidase ImmA (M78 family)
VVKYVPDNMHDFGERPHYEPRELDSIFERIVNDFLRKKHGEVGFPITTDDLTTLIEGHVADLDQYADLTGYGTSVEGATVFARSDKPKVLISTLVHKHQNRLRTTLAHEFVHVHLHAYLFGLLDGQMRLSGTKQAANAIACRSDTILTARKVDWREWQAGYGSGAMLMPRSALMRVVGDIQRRNGVYGPIAATTPNGQALIDAIVEEFEVSRDAARVRLSVLGVLGQETASNSLFS